MALFDLSDLALHLQYELDTDTAQLAHDNAQGIIEGRLGRPVTQATSTPRLPVQRNDRRLREYGNEYTYGGLIVLPGGPITSVSDVQAGGVSLDATAWEWDRFDTVYVSTAEPTAAVTYTSGYATVPGDLQAVALALAGRIYSQPVAAVRSEQIDDYSVSYETSGSTPMDLSPLELMVLDRYRSRAAMIGQR